MAIQHKIAARTGRLLRRYPRLRRGEEVRLYAQLTIQAEALLQALVDGTDDPRKLRALTETQRMIVDVGRSLGLIRAQPRAGQQTDEPDEGDDDWRKYMYPEEADQ